MNDFEMSKEKSILYFRSQWQFGDWLGLSQIDTNSYVNHPNYKEVILLHAVGLLNQGEIDKANFFLKEVLDDDLYRSRLFDILISGVYNSLGRSYLLRDLPKKAFENFRHSLDIDSDIAPTHFIAKARMEFQKKLLSKILNVKLPKNEDWKKYKIRSKKTTFPDLQKSNIQSTVNHNLGKAWSANTVNTVIFRHHAILTKDNFQYTAFYPTNTLLRIVQRNLNDETLETFDITGIYNLRDAHNCISLGIDNGGHLHICYDHHASPLKYRRALKSHCIDHWTQELPMTGVNEDKVTYPTFILPRDNHPLTVLYRYAGSQNGTVFIKTYNEETKLWIDHPKPILTGATPNPWTSNPYWNHPAIGTDGSIHLSYVWRTHSLGKNYLVNNINIGYAQSLDNGYSWYTSNQKVYRLPITQVNSETIWPVPPGNNLINQCSMALDSHNRPHIAFYSNNKDGIPQYQHLWFDEGVWKQSFLSHQLSRFNLEGKQTLKIPMSRPEIIIDKEDNIIIIYRTEWTDNKLVAQVLNAPFYDNETEIYQVSDISIGQSEPLIDRTRWQRDEVLTIYCQRSDQPNHDIKHEQQFHDAQLIDVNMDLNTI